MLCYAVHLGLLLVCGSMLNMGVYYLGGIVVAAGIAAYHYTLIRTRERDACFYAFRHNNWLGAAVFAGVLLDYALR
jgi:4-hydroxybenzoate polyprenyltransferase